MKASRNIGIPIGMPGMHQDHECILRLQVRDSLGGAHFAESLYAGNLELPILQHTEYPLQECNRHSFGIAGGARNPEPIADWIQRSSAKRQGEEALSSFVPYTPEAEVW